MQNQNLRIILYSSMAIALLAVVWGLRQIPEQGRLAEHVLRESLEQELIVLNGAVKASTQALKFRLLDVLKAEGNDHATRAFQDSPFQVATLLEWDQVQWKPLWYSNKSKADFQAEELKTWMKDWPLSKLALDEVYFAKVGDIQGQAYFAILVPVRRPNQVPLMGVGIFPAAQFGLSLAADENREVRVFTQSGQALMLTHPAYLGASLKHEPLVQEILESDEVSLRHEWKAENGVKKIGSACRIGDSNLYAAIESRASMGSAFQTWIYLALCALGAVALNWVLFSSVLRPLLNQLSISEESAEHLRRQLVERTQSKMALPNAKLAQLDFQEDEAPVEPEATPAPTVPVEMAVLPAPFVALEKIMQATLRTFDAKIKELHVNVVTLGLKDLKIDGDGMQLQTALEEILKNSLEAMHGTAIRNLTISGKAQAGRLHLTIEDSGSGIAPENLEKVFDPFFSTKDSEGVARGLGLNVVRRVVEEISGSVKLHSHQGEISGTRVEIDWPLEAAPQTLAETVYSLDDIDDDNGMVFQPVPTQSWPDIAVRKPKVRTLD